MATPYLDENLATAHFFSPSEATKPFDTNGDGYYRGERVSLVVLKNRFDALADNDNALDVNTVLHSDFQSELYHRVPKEAGNFPQDIHLVEAHRTGILVSGLFETESIRNILRGPERSAPFFMSSSNIGYLEGASGVAGLIKAILQMEHRTACVHASFQTLNPKIPVLEPENFSIPTSNRPRSGNILTACINNYGAVGNNAANAC
ncbi:hypothetical protein AYL99_02670 [Fonsecaea erecta]|uniref:Ketosynthase family 3 (KS3) domain-containing protein n=1 Tax=Fonsecaea erecta TaxID=1367422 RepID=A0A178ZW17_9EURO|nr:hypothetical protein AYL99_02670 [Fonsecaea erecta]OAP63443.1 hypothetical protein AYL99_02670 [Fonsecaea erecta]